MQRGLYEIRRSPYCVLQRNVAHCCWHHWQSNSSRCMQSLAEQTWSCVLSANDAVFHKAPVTRYFFACHHCLAHISSAGMILWARCCCSCHLHRHHHHHHHHHHYHHHHHLHHSTFLTPTNKFLSIEHLNISGCCGLGWPQGSACAAATSPCSSLARCPSQNQSKSITLSYYCVYLSVSCIDGNACLLTWCVCRKWIARILVVCPCIMSKLSCHHLASLCQRYVGVHDMSI